MENNITEGINQVDCGGDLMEAARKYADFYHPHLAILVCLFGTIANILNIAVLTRKDMFCTPINRILTALAVADMILMIEYIPYAYYYYTIVKKNKDFTYAEAAYMLGHSHVTQILHTMSICLTLTLAIWRYLAIGYPHKSNILCSEKRCTIAIVLSYVLPFILCAPTYTTMTITAQKISESNETVTIYHTDLNEMYKNDKMLLQLVFLVYAVIIKLLPCCILTVISCWLIQTLFKAKKRKEVLKNYNCIPLKEIESEQPKRQNTKFERQADRTTKMLIAVLCLFLVTEFPQGIFAILIGVKGKNLFLQCYQVYGEVMDILALLNGAINFILYCCMNRMFRSTFGQLFKHKFLGNWAASSEVHTTTGTNSTEL